MRIFEIVDVVNIKLAELDVCVYLMSAVAVQMEVEEGANATVTELLTALLEEEDCCIQISIFNQFYPTNHPQRQMH